MYKKLLEPTTGEVAQHCILRTSDGSIIPRDPANSDYQAFLIWYKDGNELLEPDPLPVPDPSAQDFEPTTKEPQ